MANLNSGTYYPLVQILFWASLLIAGPLLLITLLPTSSPGGSASASPASVPEINGATAVSAITLVTGAAFIIRGRNK